MRFKGKWRAFDNQEAESLKKTLEYNWGFSCKVDGRVIIVEGEHSHPENIRDYLMGDLDEIEFMRGERGNER